MCSGLEFLLLLTRSRGAGLRKDDGLESSESKLGSFEGFSGEMGTFSEEMNFWGNYEIPTAEENRSCSKKY